MRAEASPCTNAQVGHSGAEHFPRHLMEVVWVSSVVIRCQNVFLLRVAGVFISIKEVITHELRVF